MSNTSVVPYPRAGDPDPLPMEVTCRRLSTEGFPAAEQHVREHLQREDYRSGQRAARQRTFLLSWDGAPDCRLAFDAPEGAVQNLADLQRDIPCDAAWERAEWRSGEPGAWTLEIACSDPSAKLVATLSTATDRIDYAITLTISEPGVWSGIDLHLCLNHCWAPGFGRGGACASSGPTTARRKSRSPTIIEETQESTMASIEPIHPGEHLAEVLDELGVSEYRLAKSIGTAPRRINEIVHGRRSITADTALRLGQALGMTPESWLNLQALYDLDVARSAIDVDAIEPLVAAGCGCAAS